MNLSVPDLEHFRVMHRSTSHKHFEVASPLGLVLRVKEDYFMGLSPCCRSALHLRPKGSYECYKCRRHVNYFGGRVNKDLTGFFRYRTSVRDEAAVFEELLFGLGRTSLQACLEASVMTDDLQGLRKEFQSSIEPLCGLEIQCRVLP